MSQPVEALLFLKESPDIRLLPPMAQLILVGAKVRTRNIRAQDADLSRWARSSPDGLLDGL